MREQPYCNRTLKPSRHPAPISEPPLVRQEPLPDPPVPSPSPLFHPPRPCISNTPVKWNDTVLVQAFPDRTLTVMLFKEVTNAAELQAKLRSRTLEPELALLNPAPVASLFHLQLAAHKAGAGAGMGFRVKGLGFRD